MAEVDLQKEIAEIAENKTGEGEAVETILATYAHTEEGSQNKKWLFRGWKTTSMFELALGENWHYRVYAEPYRPLWEETIKILDKRTSSDPALIDLDIKYEWIEDRRIAVHLRQTKIRELDPGEEFGLEPAEPTAK